MLSDVNARSARIAEHSCSVFCLSCSMALCRHRSAGSWIVPASAVTQENIYLLHIDSVHSHVVPQLPTAASVAAMLTDFLFLPVTSKDKPSATSLQPRLGALLFAALKPTFSSHRERKKNYQIIIDSERQKGGCSAPQQF